MPVALSASIPAPALGRPSSTASIATPAITPARMTLGSGVTRTMKPLNPRAATTTRVRRPPPHSAVSQNMAPTTIAQFAPLTAVRWLSPLVRMSSLSSVDTARVSPTASPGRRPAPGSGRPVDRSTKALRTSAATANTPDAGTSTEAVLANTTRADLSLGAVDAASPFTLTVAPRSNPSAGSMPTRTGADAARTDPGDPMPVRCTSIHRRPSRPTDADDVTSPVASTTRPSHDAALSRAGIAVMAAMDTAAAAARSTTISPALDAVAVRSRRFSTTPSTAPAPSALPHAHHPAAAGTNTQRSATIHTATAMGSIRRSRLMPARRHG